MLLKRPRVFAALATCTLLLGLGACDDDESASSGGKKKLTPAQRLCNKVGDALSSCGQATPCDEALLADCADLAAMLSDPYLEAAADCIDAGGVPQDCFVDALSSLAPTQAHNDFGAKFCAECLFGLPGCEETLFGAGDGDQAIARALILPLGDNLVNQIADECASGLSCATFPSCVQGVLAQQALPENTLQCVIDSLTGNIPPGEESNCSNGEGASGSGANGSGASGAGGNASGGSGAGGQIGDPGACYANMGACNPLLGQCGAGEQCFWDGMMFMCGAGSTQSLGEMCDGIAGPFCNDGLACVTLGNCHAACCENSDCAAGQTCETIISDPQTPWRLCRGACIAPGEACMFGGDCCSASCSANFVCD